MTTDEQTISLLTDWSRLLTKGVSIKERLDQGKRVREVLSRKDHSKWSPSRHREPTVDLLMSQDTGRIEDLVPIKYGRMMESPFAFFRGAAIVMAHDLASMPRTELMVQLCGDCHLSNFGVFATPERNVIFDLNDFDETLPGSFEWDIKRLAASFVIAAQDNGFSRSVAEKSVQILARTYREKMEEFSEMSTLDVWYHRIDWNYLVQHLQRSGKKGFALADLEKLKEKRSHRGALAKLTEKFDGELRIRDSLPLIFHPDKITLDVIKAIMSSYSKSLWQSRRRLLERYRFVDAAVKVVGVGSVGVLAAVMLLHGEGGDDDYIFLQLKQALPSVFEWHVGKSEFSHPGERIVCGQRILQSASDMFLGWASGPVRDFYVRQLMDVKSSIPVSDLDQQSFKKYAEICAYALARAHARTGDPIQLYGYLGRSEMFDEALVNFAFAYAKQNEKDYEALVKGIKAGKIRAVPEEELKQPTIHFERGLGQH